ncbi:MAG: PucR family transcriptional regulator [Bifidobacteriaceae bacterium]|jgi:purine catabolism regulator|nr:PucR family transcriptional regulator [Bifidobacteriaceae bacterium]
MVALRDVLASSRLGLRLMTASDQQDRPIRWAHVSELKDPTPWLEGGELLLTTGLGLNLDEEGWQQYCARLVALPVAALGISTGKGMPHPGVPFALIEAAEALHLPLIDVPAATPLQSVVKVVADALNAEANGPLRSTIDLHTSLSQAAASSDGLRKVIERLHEHAQVEAIVLDRFLRPLTPGGFDISPDLRRDIVRRVLAKPNGSLTASQEGLVYAAQPIAFGGLMRGILVIRSEGPLEPVQLTAIKVATPILGLLLDRHHALGAHHRSQKKEQVDRLLSSAGEAPQAVEALAAMGIEPEYVQVVALHCERLGLLRAMAAGVMELLDGTEILYSRIADTAWLVVCDPPAFDYVKALPTVLGPGAGVAAGVGDKVRVEDAPLSARRARQALDIALDRGTEVEVYQDHSAGSITSLGSIAEQSAFADAVLGAIDLHDAQGGRANLGEALEAFFSVGGNLETAAARLGIHRHTMRARMAEVQELTGRSLTNPDDYLSLWLACSLRRQNSTNHPGATA